EVVVALAAGGIAHFFRENDTPGLPWRAAPVFATGAGRIDAVTMIQSNFGSPGNLEVVARTGDRLIFLWRDSGPGLQWHGPFPLIADGREPRGFSGVPSLIQSRFGSRGNFELLVALAQGGFAFFWRDNDRPDLPWHGPFPVEVPNAFEALALIQSNFGSPGNLEVLSRNRGELAHSWRDSGPQLNWHGPFPLASG